MDLVNTAKRTREYISFREDEDVEGIVELGFWAMPNGHIHCETCGNLNVPWCEHCEKLVRANGDAEAVWLENRPSIHHIEVPMFPNLNMWRRTELVFVPRLDAYKMTIATPNMTEPYTVLGFLHEGEGRMVMRSMILDWFVAFAPSDLMCRASSHKFRQEMKWQDDMKDHNKAIVQRWSVWSNGVCTGCTMADDWADLIPEDASGKRSVF